MQFITSHLLSLMIFFPLVCSIALLPIKHLQTVKVLSMITSLIVFAMTGWMWFAFNGESSGLQFVENYAWLPDFGIRFFVGVDGLSLLLVVLSGFLTPLILLSQWHVEDSKQRYFISLVLGLEAMMIGALVAIDMIFFYVFWEAMLIPMYFMIGIWGGDNRIYATMKFFIYTMVGSLLMLAAALVLYHFHIKEFGVPSTNLLDLLKLNLPESSQYWLYLAFALAFAIKVPLWPFHTWLPDAHVQAPTSGSVVLAGILLKMGTYGFLRFAIPLFPEAAVMFAPLFIALGITGIVYGALVAWVQTDAKKLVAYSSVSHLGFVVIGCLAFSADGNSMSTEALTGAIYQMINHGISTGALFFLVGVIYERRHTRLLADFGGLAKAMPWFAVLFIVATLSSVGLPGTGGFIGEFLILLGTFQTNPFAGILAASGVLLGAIYMLTLCKALLWGPLDNPENQSLSDVNGRELSYLVPLAVLAVLMGVAPGLFLDKTRTSIEYFAKNFKQYTLTIDGASQQEGESH